MYAFHVYCNAINFVKIINTKGFQNIFFTFLIVCHSYNAHAQLTLVIDQQLFIDELFDNVKKDTIDFENSFEMYDFGDEIVLEAIKEGHLTASYSIQFISKDTATFQFQIGNKYKWAILDFSLIDNSLLQSMHIDQKEFNQNPIDIELYLQITETLLKYSENRGYPFASVYLDHAQISDSTVSAILHLQQNRQFFFDTIIVNGNLTISYAFLENYLGIKKGMVYQEERIQEIDEKMRELAFVSVVKSNKIKYEGDKVTIILNCNVKNASKFDFILGILPNNAISGRILWTGDGSLHLQNVFNQAETFDASFTKLESTSKSANVSFVYPYLPFIQLGVDGSFLLYLKDSLFLEKEANAGILYQFIGNNYLKTFYSIYTSDILYIDSILITSTKKLPASLDIKIPSYGIELQIENLDYINNPKNGVFLKLKTSFGTKKIKENSTILSFSDETFDFGSLYDSISKNSLQINYELNVAYYITLFGNFVGASFIRIGGIVNENIVTNELYRIGGNKILRGFDDQSVFVSDFIVSTLEIRYLFATNSYANLFYDQAFTKNQVVSTTEISLLSGLGAGINFETKAGIFGLQYALGKQKGNLVLLKEAKVHFGYINYF